jgi:cytoplasmic iron level regulating protein YaaA (DUF328/UPF0246 family)
MKIVISPAKSLDFDSKLPTSRGTQPQFLEQAEILNNAMEKKSKKAIRELMSISDNLAALNYQRYKDFSTPFNKSNARPAVYAFSGDVYQGLDAYSVPADKLESLQDKLRILSGMYGLLRPLDLMQPYRLEMGTDLKVRRKKNLYDFWGDSITKALNEELEDGELFLNLASNEYFKVVKPSKLKVPVITPVFKDLKNGKMKMISFFAKKARGSMVRYIIDHDINTLEGVKGFDYDGYRFSEEHTSKKGELVFIR